MNKGFTLVELLAVIIVIGLLMAFTIPSYTQIHSEVKRDNYNNKMTEVKIAGNDYGETIKDQIKNRDNSCIDVTISDLIKKGFLRSESDKNSELINPTNNKTMDGNVKICYCRSLLDISSEYYYEFKNNKWFYKNEVVQYNGKLYKCMIDYNGTSVFDTNKDGKPYFVEIEC